MRVHVLVCIFLSCTILSAVRRKKKGEAATQNKETIKKEGVKGKFVERGLCAVIMVIRLCPHAIREPRSERGTVRTVARMWAT